MPKSRYRGRIVVLSKQTVRRQGAQRLLENRGFHTIATASTEEATILVREWRPDVLVVEAGLSAPRNCSRVVSMGATARAMLSDIDAVIGDPMHYVAAGSHPTERAVPAPCPPETEETELREVVDLADEATRRDLILSFRRVGSQFRIETSRTAYSLPFGAARTFLVALLGQLPEN